MNQYAHTFSESYKHPTNQQAVSLTVSIPVFEWGINKNKKNIAENFYEIQQIDNENIRKAYDNQIIEMVSTYNHALQQKNLAWRSYELSVQQYQLIIKRFAMERVSVSDLYTVQQSLGQSMQRYYDTLNALYTHYYELRILTLYDFMKQKTLFELI